MYSRAAFGSGIGFANHWWRHERTGRQLLYQIPVVDAVKDREVQISAFGAPVVYAVLNSLYGSVPSTLSHLGRDTGANWVHDQPGDDPCNKEDQHA
jgi:hypothetical protein